MHGNVARKHLLDGKFTDEVNDDRSIGGGSRLDLDLNGQRLLEKNENGCAESKNRSTVGEVGVKPSDVELVGRNVVRTDLKGNREIGVRGSEAPVESMIRTAIA